MLLFNGFNKSLMKSKEIIDLVNINCCVLFQDGDLMLSLCINQSNNALFHKHSIEECTFFGSDRSPRRGNLCLSACLSVYFIL